MKTPGFASSFCLLSLLMSASVLAAADFIWTGMAGSGFAHSGSWENATAPAAGATSRCGRFFIANGDKAPFTYTEKEGATVLECDDFKIGSNGRPGGALLMTGGELVISSRWSPMVAHNNNRASNLTLTGGRLTIRNVQGAKESERNFRIGNWNGGNTRGVVNIRGGILVIETSGSMANGGLIIANGEAGGEIFMEGGMVVVGSIYGTTFQAAEGSGVGVLAFGLGDGVFMQTDSKQLNFGAGAGGAASHINFVLGSKGQLSLAGATREDFESWVKAGRIRIGGQKTTPDRFKYTEIEGQGIYQLAASR